ncbi:MAG: aminotransferase class V-fold PLP-dependent enzyme [Ferrimicrobium sp.]
MVQSYRNYFSAGAGYLDTASYGLPPVATVEALTHAITSWQSGTADWMEEWLPLTNIARERFAALIGVPPRQVATGPSTSTLVALIASSLPDTALVVAPEIEFTSNLFPYLVHQHRGVRVHTVADDALAESITDETTLVALSATQSATGRVADLDAIKTACRTHDALLVVDTTQSAGWLPIDPSGIDAIVCSAYKWLLSPRGTAYLALSDRLAEMLTPLYANWYGGDPIADAFYGPPLRLTRDQRRLDPSPAWFSWVGAAASLSVISEIGVESIYRHNTSLTAHLRDLLGIKQPTQPSAIVTLKVTETLSPKELPFLASVRNGALRISCHLYNDLDDIEQAAQILRPHLV